MDTCPDIPPPNFTQDVLFAVFLFSFVRTAVKVLRTPHTKWLVSGIFLLGAASSIDFFLGIYPTLQAYACTRGLLLPSISEWFDVAKTSAVHFEVILGSLLLIHRMKLTLKKTWKGTYWLYYFTAQLLLKALTIAIRESKAQKPFSATAFFDKFFFEGAVFWGFALYLDALISVGLWVSCLVKALKKITQLPKPEKVKDVRKVNRIIFKTFNDSGLLYTLSIFATMIVYDTKPEAVYTSSAWEVQGMGILLSLFIRSFAKQYQELLEAREANVAAAVEQAPVATEAVDTEILVDVSAEPSEKEMKAENDLMV